MAALIYSVFAFVIQCYRKYLVTKLIPAVQSLMDLNYPRLIPGKSLLRVHLLKAPY